MSTFDTLPVILVSVADEAAATALISELIDNDVTADFVKDTHSPDRVWRLVNKYYTANVRVHTLTDNGRLDVDPDAIEAHIIHLTEEETAGGAGGAAGVARAERRLRTAGAARRAHTRLLVCGAAPGGALLAWSARARAEPLALCERAPDGGVRRARDALHAHAWRGLLRTDRAAPARSPGADADVHTESPLSDLEATSSSSCSDSEDEEARELRAVEHAEAFAAALGALGPALAERAPAAREPARLDRAEHVVRAFCRALGLDPDC